MRGSVSASMEYLVIDPNAPSHKQKSTGSKLQDQLKKVFYTDGHFGGKDLVLWFQTILFYCCFYFGLFIVWMVFWEFFILAIDKNVPRYHQAELYYSKTPQQLAEEGPNEKLIDTNIGLLLPNPGMSYRPVPDYRSNLLRFVQGRPSSYKPYTDHIQTYLEMYEDKMQEGEVFMDCDNINDVRDKNMVCRFKVDWLGSGCTWQMDYGYDDGQPCVLLKLNKIFGWEPIPYIDNATRPMELGDRWSPQHIGITCEGEGPLDKENIGPLQITPSEGFPVIYYPYLNQEGYRQPLVFLKFMRPANGVVINVWCKAWARNIIHHREDRTGSIHFELLVD